MNISSISNSINSTFLNRKKNMENNSQAKPSFKGLYIEDIVDLGEVAEKTSLQTIIKKDALLLNEIAKSCKLQEVPLEVATKRNPNIYSSSKPHKNREEFLEYVCIKNNFLQAGVKKYLKTPFHIFIYRLLPQFAKNFIKYKILKMEK